jgi:putative copper export protein
VSELTWTLGSAAASIAQVAGLALAVGALAALWLLHAPIADAGNDNAADAAADTRALATLRRLGTLGAAAALAGAVLRTLLQSAALAESPGAFATMLQPVIFETQLGGALRLQAGAAIAGVIGFALSARWRRSGLAIAGVAAALLTATPGLGGHPAAHAHRTVALVGSVLHVAGLALWLGTLAALTFTARHLGDAALARGVRRFHALAAVGLGAVVATGVAKLVDLRPPVAELPTSPWGIALLLKLAAFALVAVWGWQHWRRADAALAAGRRTEVLRSFGSELVLATLALLATGVLVNSMPPERHVDAGPPANPDVVATRLYSEIASPFCPGMSLTSCPSDGAFQLKRRIRARLEVIGPDSVMAELAAEFGPGISGATPTRGFGLVAWLAPFAALAVGALGILAWTRRSTQRARAIAAVPAPTVQSTGVAAGSVAHADAAELARLAQALRADD